MFNRTYCIDAVHIVLSSVNTVTSRLNYVEPLGFGSLSVGLSVTYRLVAFPTRVSLPGE
jgi:hypothetical protein